MTFNTNHKVQCSNLKVQSISTPLSQHYTMQYHLVRLF